MIGVIIVALLENTSIEYSLEPLSLCVCVVVVVYENSSDEFDTELHRIKVKVTVGIQKFYHSIYHSIVQLWYKLGTLY